MSEELLNEESTVMVPSTHFRQETIHDILPEHGALYAQHCKEVGWFKQDEPEMMWSDYYAMERANFLRIYTIRNAAYQLIGYGLYFVRKNLHYASVVVACCDMIFILPKYRGGTGEAFIEWIDENLKREGVQAVSQHAKKYYDFGSMLNRLQYEHVENIYIRRLQ